MGHPEDPEFLAPVDGGDVGWDYATTGDIEWIDEDGTPHLRGHLAGAADEHRVMVSET